MRSYAQANPPELEITMQALAWQHHKACLDDFIVPRSSTPQAGTPELDQSSAHTRGQVTNLEDCGKDVQI